MDFILKGSLYFFSNTILLNQGFKSVSMKKSGTMLKPFYKSESMIKSNEHALEDDLSKNTFRGVRVKKSEIRLKTENLHPCSTHTTSKSTLPAYQGSGAGRGGPARAARPAGSCC